MNSFLHRILRTLTEGKLSPVIGKMDADDFQIGAHPYPIPCPITERPTVAELTIPKLLERPELCDYFTISRSDFESFCKAFGKKLEPVLLEELPHRSPLDRVRLCKILYCINPTKAKDCLLDVLETDEPKGNGAGAALKIIYFEGLENPSNTDRLILSLQRHLQTLDGWWAEDIAISVLLTLEIPKREEMLACLVSSRRLPLKAVEFLANQGNPAAWPAVSDWIASDPAWRGNFWTSAQWFEPAMSILAIADPSLTSQIASKAREQVMLMIDNSYRDWSERAVCLIELYYSATQDRDLELLESIANSSLDSRLRHAAKLAIFDDHILGHLPNMSVFSTERAHLHELGWEGQSFG